MAPPTERLWLLSRLASFMTEAAALLEELGLLRARGCNCSVTGLFGGRSCLVAVAACWQQLLKGYGCSVFVTHLSLCLFSGCDGCGCSAAA